MADREVLGQLRRTHSRHIGRHRARTEGPDRQPAVLRDALGKRGRLLLTHRRLRRSRSATTYDRSGVPARASDRLQRPATQFARGSRAGPARRMRRARPRRRAARQVEARLLESVQLRRHQSGDRGSGASGGGDASYGPLLHAGAVGGSCEPASSPFGRAGLIHRRRLPRPPFHAAADRVLHVLQSRRPLGRAPVGSPRGGASGLRASRVPYRTGGRSACRPDAATSCDGALAAPGVLAEKHRRAPTGHGTQGHGRVHGRRRRLRVLQRFVSIRGDGLPATSRSRPGSAAPRI